MWWYTVSTRTQKSLIWISKLGNETVWNDRDKETTETMLGVATAAPPGGCLQASGYLLSRGYHGGHPKLSISRCKCSEMPRLSEALHSVKILNWYGYILGVTLFSIGWMHNNLFPKYSIIWTLVCDALRGLPSQNIVGRSLRVQSHRDLHSKFQASQGYGVRSCLGITKPLICLLTK